MADDEDKKDDADAAQGKSLTSDMPDMGEDMQNLFDEEGPESSAGAESKKGIGSKIAGGLKSFAKNAADDLMGDNENEEEQENKAEKEGGKESDIEKAFRELLEALDDAVGDVAFVCSETASMLKKAKPEGGEEEAPEADQTADFKGTNTPHLADVTDITDALQNMFQEDESAGPEQAAAEGSDPSGPSDELQDKMGMIQKCGEILSKLSGLKDMMPGSENAEEDKADAGQESKQDEGQDSGPGAAIEQLQKIVKTVMNAVTSALGGGDDASPDKAQEKGAEAGQDNKQDPVSKLSDTLSNVGKELTQMKFSGGGEEKEAGQSQDQEKGEEKGIGGGISKMAKQLEGMVKQLGSALQAAGGDMGGLSDAGGQMGADSGGQQMDAKQGAQAGMTAMRASQGDPAAMMEGAQQAQSMNQGSSAPSPSPGGGGKDLEKLTGGGMSLDKMSGAMGQGPGMPSGGMGNMPPKEGNKAGSSAGPAGQDAISQGVEGVQKGIEEVAKAAESVGAGMGGPEKSGGMRPGKSKPS